MGSELTVDETVTKITKKRVNLAFCYKKKYKICEKTNSSSSKK